MRLSPCPSGLLVISVQRFADASMYNESDVSFIDAHATISNQLYARQAWPNPPFASKQQVEE